jgi:hypothetical protein
MKNNPIIIREDLPPNVANIIDLRCADLIKWSCNYAKFGTLKIDEIARSAYLQGFCDALEARDK